VLSLLYPGIPGQAEQLSNRFRSAQPFRHLVVDNFLEPEFCRKLIGQFPAFDSQRALNEFGNVGRKAVVRDLPRVGPPYRDFDRLMRSGEFLSLIGRISGVEHPVYDPDYVGGGTHENLHGQDLDPHVDFNFHPNRPLHRRLNLIVFLNPEWEQSWGGCLELSDNPWLAADRQRSEAIVPSANRAVLFETTEKSWHGFQQIRLPEDKRHLSRKSIAVYFYSADRPATETAPSHATVYVPRPLPARLQSGYTLGEEDVREIHDLVTRRDDQLRFLYERELEVSEVIQGMLRSPSFRIGRTLTWPLRKLRALRSTHRGL
jgi:hypothetical protein